MNHEESQALGALLRSKRQDLGYSTYQLAKAAGVDQSVVVRFEQGKFAAPRPDKLARFAEALGLSLADVYARAGYLVPDELPSFSAYLSAKYPELPSSAAAELNELFTELTTRHGVLTKPPISATEELLDEATGATG